MTINEYCQRINATKSTTAQHSFFMISYGLDQAEISGDGKVTWYKNGVIFKIFNIDSSHLDIGCEGVLPKIRRIIFCNTQLGNSFSENPPFSENSKNKNCQNPEKLENCVSNNCVLGLCVFFNRKLSIILENGDSNTINLKFVEKAAIKLENGLLIQRDSNFDSSSERLLSAIDQVELFFFPGFYSQLFPIILHNLAPVIPSLPSTNKQKKNRLSLGKDVELPISSFNLPFKNALMVDFLKYNGFDYIVFYNLSQDFYFIYKSKIEYEYNSRNLLSKTFEEIESQSNCLSLNSIQFQQPQSSYISSDGFTPRNSQKVSFITPVKRESYKPSFQLSDKQSNRILSRASINDSPTIHKNQNAPYLKDFANFIPLHFIWSENSPQLSSKLLESDISSIRKIPFSPKAFKFTSGHSDNNLVFLHKNPNSIFLYSLHNLEYKFEIAAFDAHKLKFKSCNLPDALVLSDETGPKSILIYGEINIPIDMSDCSRAGPNSARKSIDNNYDGCETEINNLIRNLKLEFRSKILDSIVPLLNLINPKKIGHFLIENMLRANIKGKCKSIHQEWDNFSNLIDNLIHNYKEFSSNHEGYLELLNTLHLVQENYKIQNNIFRKELGFISKIIYRLDSFLDLLDDLDESSSNKQITDSTPLTETRNHYDQEKLLSIESLVFNVLNGSCSEKNIRFSEFRSSQKLPNYNNPDHNILNSFKAAQNILEMKKLAREFFNLSEPLNFDHLFVRSDSKQPLAVNLSLVEKRILSENFCIGVTIPFFLLKLLSLGDLYTNNKLMEKKSNPPEYLGFNLSNPNNWDDFVGFKNLPYGLFKNDLRLLEVKKRIQSHLPVGLRPFSSSLKKFGVSIYNKMPRVFESLEFLSTVHQTMATPFGRACYTLDSRPVKTNEKLTVPDLVVAVKIKSAKNLKIPEEGYIEKGPLALFSFSNGISTALSISSDSISKLGPSWILFNTPMSLNSVAPDLKFGDPHYKEANLAYNNSIATYSGVIFGLGLRGGDDSPIKNIPIWRMIPLMNMRIDILTSSFLLGRACCFIGTGNSDPQIVNLLKLHAPKFKSLASSYDHNLEESKFISIPVQTAAVLGLGILFRGTGEFDIINLFANQINPRSEINSINKKISSRGYRDGSKQYTIFCGLSLGLVCLGRGDKLMSNLKGIDNNLFDILFSEQGIDSIYRIGSRQIHNNGQEIKNKSAELAIVTSLALGYLGTGNEPVVSYLSRDFDENDILEKIEPNLLILKSMARWLISIDSIEPTLAFMFKESIPENLKYALFDMTEFGDFISPEMEKPKNSLPKFKLLKHETHSLKRAYVLIVTGFIFSLSMKYSGTHSQQAKTLVVAVIHEFLDEIEGSNNYKDSSSKISYEESITKSTMSYSCTILSLCLSVIIQ
ncbi:Anaphase-promoting complex subunit 1 [Smittium mucronatum]|uniref:Anaphase-promoting complex subunit 1 n=1 Tax=Smittium mucronatum TaxID=133383 RepID=A0A1R0GSK3_9FUNG|nr:Anaphase-promoting complex subunit 1 [Smittium mucronatum]